jgi:hypothetical protein
MTPKGWLGWNKLDLIMATLPSVLFVYPVVSFLREYLAKVEILKSCAITKSHSRSYWKLTSENFHTHSYMNSCFDFHQRDKDYWQPAMYADESNDSDTSGQSHTHMYAYMQACTYIYTYTTHAHAYTTCTYNVHTYIYTYIYVHAHTYIRYNIHTYIHKIYTYTCT